MRYVWILAVCVLAAPPCRAWGFYAHKKINELAVYLLPPQMLVFYKPHAGYLSEHAADPDKRRYVVKDEAPRHYIDMDRYGHYPYDSLPRLWHDAVIKYHPDTLAANGIVPWWLPVMLQRLTQAFKEKNAAAILKYSAELGHYIADAHVPLHASSNHNGQYTNQHGIHGFWESRIPELLAYSEWDFFIGPARYIAHPSRFAWARVLESAAAADTVLRYEKELTARFPAHEKYAFEERNGRVQRQYSSAFARAYDALLNGMVERRMRQSIFAVASWWYTAWVNAGQPNLSALAGKPLPPESIKEMEELEKAWKNRTTGAGEHDH